MVKTMMTKDNNTASLSNREMLITVALVSPLLLILAVILGIMAG